MRPIHWLAAPIAATLCLPATLSNAGEPESSARIAAAESAFTEFQDAADSVSLLESGYVDRVQGRDLAAWKQAAGLKRTVLTAKLAAAEASHPSSAGASAVAAMRQSVANYASDAFDVASAGAPVATVACQDAQRHDLDYAGMRASLVRCYVEYGNQLQFEGSRIDRGSALQLLHVIDEPARRKALFDSFVPLWMALNGRNESSSPYRRMIAMAAADARHGASEIDTAARAIGVSTSQVERWLVQVLEAWRDVTGPGPIEPWDYRYVSGEANRKLATRIPPEALLPANHRFYADLGADPEGLGVLFDLAPRADKSPLAYTEFLRRGRTVGTRWQAPLARVVGMYPTGGLFSLNELVHETGHAVHVSAIHTRPAFMDWPDSLFAEAFADVPSWSTYEPSWQRRYLGDEVPETVALRALFSDVMLDVSWSLFELRMLHKPKSDPNAVWTDITSRYLHIVPHPEVPWWAMRVQLVDSPGYMVNYGLGAVLTADMRERTATAIGPFDAGNAQWYAWLSEQLLRFGSERDTRLLLQAMLGRPVSPDAMLRQLQRCQTR
jgi:hypothetical protein